MIHSWDRSRCCSVTWHFLCSCHFHIVPMASWSCSHSWWIQMQFIKSPFDGETLCQALESWCLAAGSTWHVLSLLRTTWAFRRWTMRVNMRKPIPIPYILQQSSKPQKKKQHPRNLALKLIFSQLQPDDGYWFVFICVYVNISFTHHLKR